MNNPSNWLILVLSLLATCSIAATDRVDTQLKEITQGESLTESSTLSASDRVRRRIWQLSEVEWLRYKQLMQGIRGSISPATISPIEVLGIHARDDTERRRYAEVWVQAMREDANRILAFQHTYDTVGRHLYPNDPLIDIDRLPEKKQKRSLFQTSDRLLFFTRPDCSVCSRFLDKLLVWIDDIDGIDIYLSDIAPGDDDVVRAWASIHQVDPDWVRSRQVTLNYDRGGLVRLSAGQGSVPYLLCRRGEDLFPVRISDL